MEKFTVIWADSNVQEDFNLRLADRRFASGIANEHAEHSVLHRT